MKLKINLILLFLLIGLSLLNARDSSPDAIEFSVGGGVKVNMSFSYIQETCNQLSFYYKDFIPGVITGISLPISFVYYFNNNLGIGVNYKLSCSYASYVVSIYEDYYIVSVDNYLNIVNKFGNNLKGKFLLLEYGIIASGKFYLSSTENYNKIYIGPSLFIGFERRSRANNFLFTVGGILDAEFNSINGLLVDSSNQAYSATATEFQFNTGVEFRWRFCYMNWKGTN